jgi:arsenate reductase
MNSRPITLYTYAKCSMCREATKWLRAHGIPFTERPIRETPPTLDELQRMLVFQDGNLRRLFNTSGVDYRERGLSTKLTKMPVSAAFRLLASNGNLVKRPFLLGDTCGLVGFDAKAWLAVLS